MGRASAKLPSFCLSGVATRIRIRPPSMSAAAAAAEKPDLLRQSPVATGGDEARKEGGGGGEKEAEAEAEGEARRVVVVAVDRSPEAKAALQWALSHAVQSHDGLLLLHVVKPPKNDRQHGNERDPKDYQLLHAMKSICQAKRPEVHVEVCLAEGRDRGPTIVEEAARRRASLLVVGGPRRRSPAVSWRLLVMWALGADLGRIGSSVADYCIHHAACAALAVRRKGRRGGGYLLTTKRHKDFWLLA